MSVYVELEVRGRHALSIVTRNWSDKEKAALDAGDADAKQAAIDEAVYLTMHDPNADFDASYVEVHLPRKSA